MSVIDKSKSTKGQIDTLDLIIGILAEHEADLDEKINRLDDQLLKLELIADRFCDFTDKLSEVIMRMERWTSKNSQKEQ